MITAVPDQLKRRAQRVLGYEAVGSICGYLGGLEGAVQYCGTGDKCAVMFDPAGSEDGTIACCNVSDQPNSCVFTDTCVDSAQYQNTNFCNDECRLDINTMKCTGSDLPYCYPQVYTRWSATGYTCDSVSYNYSGTVDPPEFSTTYVGQTDHAPWTAVFDTVGNPFARHVTGTIAEDNGSSQPSAPLKSSTTPPLSGSASIASASSGGGNGNLVGPIVGAVLGGVLLLGACILGGVWLCLRERRKRWRTGSGGGSLDMPHPPSVPGFKSELENTLVVVSQPGDLEGSVSVRESQEPRGLVRTELPTDVFVETGGRPTWPEMNDQWRRAELEETRSKERNVI